MKVPVAAITFYGKILNDALVDLEGHAADLDKALAKDAQRLVKLGKIKGCAHCGRGDAETEIDRVREDMQDNQRELRSIQAVITCLRKGDIAGARKVYRRAEIAWDSVEQALFLQEL